MDKIKIRALYNDGPDSGYRVGDTFEASLHNDYYYFYDNEGLHRMRHKSEFELIDDVPRLPVRTMIRKKIIPGTYGVVSITKENKILIQRGSYTHEQLREAAHILNQIAEALEDGTTL